MDTSFDDRMTGEQIQLDIFVATCEILRDRTLDAAFTGVDTNDSKRSLRKTVLPFPDLDDTQLSFLPPPAQNQDAWTMEDIERFHLFCLAAAIRSLYDKRASAELRDKVVDWIARDLVEERLLPNTPLSFQAACAMCGWDPEKARERTLSKFAPERLRLPSVRHS